MAARVGSASDYVARIARNIVELRVWVEYCAGSGEAAATDPEQEYANALEHLSALFHRVDGREIGMVQRCQHLRFAREAGHAVGVLRERLRESKPHKPLHLSESDV